MFKRNFLNVHVLISHASNLINRDKDGKQKTMMFGGKSRARISSQCLKRAMRLSKYYQEHLGDPSIRTRELLKLKGFMIEKLGNKYDPETIKLAMDLLAGTEEVDEKDKVQSKAVIPWSVNEISEFCSLVQKANKQKGDDKKSDNRLNSLIKEHKLKIMASIGQSVDIALSGRMTTSGLMMHVDGALSLQHAFTTHEAVIDVDWFNAADTLIQQEGGSQAGHMGSQSFSSGVFYRYGSVNLKQLADNMAGGNDEVLNVCAHVAHLLATVVPEAKQHSHANFNIADYVLVSFSEIPLSASTAFEKPVTIDRGGGYLAPSISAFEDYVQRIYRAYELDERKAVFTLWDSAIKPKMETLKGLKSWILQSGE